MNDRLSSWSSTRHAGWLAAVVALAGACTFPAQPPASERPPAAQAAPSATPPRPEAAAQPTPAPTHHLEPEVLTRTGGRLVGAIRDQSYYVRYELQAGLRLAALHRAASGKSFAFEVLPFRQSDAQPVPGGFHVERAGEIVAAALALQLDQMGYRVGLELAKALAPLQERLGDRFKIDLDAFALKASFSGDVQFWVAHPARDGRYETTARLVVSVVLSGDRAGRAAEIYRRVVVDFETLQAEGPAGASERARRAAAAVLQRFVRTLTTDPRLEAALVSFVSGR